LKNKLRIKLNQCQTETVNIYSYQNDIYINTLAKTGTVKIYSLTGVELYSSELKNVISTHLASGVYFVKVETQKGVYTQNVFINK